MNERIQELWEQAGGTFDSGNQHVWPHYKIDNPAKFMELIVRECTDIISPYAVRMENFDGGHPVADLKKHFGVK